MIALVANPPVSVWTLMSLNATQMADAFPQLKRFFEAGYVLHPLGHDHNIVALRGQFNDLRINLESGEFE